MSVFEEMHEVGTKVVHGIEAVGREIEHGAEHLAADASAKLGAGQQNAGCDPASITQHDNWNSWNHQRIYTMLHDIDPERIRDKADHWSKIGGQIRQIFEGLERELQSTISGGWEGAAAGAAAQAPTALAEWGRTIAASAESTGASMLEAATGAERAQRAVHPPSDLEWNSALSGVLDHLLKPGSASGGGRAPSEDASRPFGDQQAGNDKARRTAGQVFSPSYVSADATVGAFPPPSDPTGGADGPASGGPGIGGSSTFSGGGHFGGGAHSDPVAGQPVHTVGADQPSSPASAPRPAHDHGPAGVPRIYDEPIVDDPIYEQPVSVGTDPASVDPMPGPSNPEPVSPAGGPGPAPVFGSPAGNPVPSPIVGGGIPTSGVPTGGVPGGGVPSGAPTGGVPGGAVPGGRVLGAPQPLPIGGSSPTTPAGPPPGGVSPAPRGGGGGIVAGVPFGGAGGRRGEKRRKAYGAGLFDDQFTGKKKPKDEQDASNADVNEGIPETEAERTGPIYLGEITGGFGPQGANSVAPPVIGER